MNNKNPQKRRQAKRPPKIIQKSTKESDWGSDTDIAALNKDKSLSGGITKEERDVILKNISGNGDKHESDK